MMPSQNTGIDWPKSAPSMVRLSYGVSRRTAEITPAGMATTSEMASAARASSMVAGSRSRTRGRAGWRYRSERPRSPWTARVTNTAYCT